MDPERFDTTTTLVGCRRQGHDGRPWRFPVDGLSKRENATMPPEQGKGHEMSLEGSDFARDVAAAFETIAMDAAVAFEIGVDERGNFIDARTGACNKTVVENYSRMKHGDMDAVSFFAGHLAATSMHNERFVSFHRNAVASERVIYMTTVAVFNVPSASNLLLKTTAGHLNIMLTKKGLAPLVVAEQTRLSESPLGYASTSVRERRNELAAGRGVTIVPENFRDQSVIFLDDLFNSGYTIERAERRLQDVNAADRFYLFAARMDPRAVGASASTIEDRLNDTFITGTLESVAPMLKRGNFAVVQKLVKVTLDPKHTDQLPEFLQEIPTSSILKLYCAAANNDYRRRYDRQFAPSIAVLETVLQERGALDAAGHIIGAPVDRVAFPS